MFSQFVAFVFSVTSSFTFSVPCSTHCSHFISFFCIFRVMLIKLQSIWEVTLEHLLCMEPQILLYTQHCGGYPPYLKEKQESLRLERENSTGLSKWFHAGGLALIPPHGQCPEDDVLPYTSPLKKVYGKGT